MQVKLISYTQDALALLLRTKNTRLGNAEDDPAAWPAEKQAEHLAYMLDTIKSSWEFVDYVFEVRGVSRAFTHQFVRTRAGSYAQESQRTVDVRDSEVVPMRWPTTSDEDAIWGRAVAHAMDSYAALIDSGVPVQEARGLLPTAMGTSIFAKFNLRTLSEMAKVRLCVRTQGEYQDVFRAMRAAVLAVHPWAAPFIEVHCAATGTCAFPRYGKSSCPFWESAMDTTALRERVRTTFWSDDAPQHVAVPVARGGKTM